MKNIKFKDYLDEQLKDEEFKKEWDSLEDEYSAICNAYNNNSKNGSICVDIEDE